MAIAPAMIGWNLRTDWAYENAAFALRAGLGWALQLAAETARLAGDDIACAELSAAAANPPLSDLVPARPDVLERYRRYTHYFDWLDTPQAAPGEALRLSTAGASFPAYPVNPGTGADPTSARRAAMRIITLGVCCGGPNASSLVVHLR